MPFNSAWMALAACTADSAVTKAASTESPAMSTTRPPSASMWRRNTARAASSCASVPGGSAAIRRE
jgi:hypothetical protein